MDFILLSHSRELDKKTNTGSLVLDYLGSRARRVVWQRKSPDESLLQLIGSQKVLLLYPEVLDAGVKTYTTPESFSSCIIIDSTWQEARKIYNRSDYLHKLPRLSLSPEFESCFRLRRNQKPGGRSTVEAAIEVLQLNNETESANALTRGFSDFQQIHSPLLKPQLLKDL